MVLLNIVICACVSTGGAGKAILLIGDISGHVGTPVVFAIIYGCSLHCTKGTGGHI